MKERPILFSAPMVRALLDGTKTQTRRVVKHRIIGPNPPTGIFDWHHPRTDEWLGAHGGGIKFNLTNAARLCPYGQPGDRLWVRESGWERPERTPRMMREGADTWPRFAYAADGWNDQDRADFKAWGFKARPSIHMPRWASRILLEIVSVRVERLQEISEADAMAEGITCENVIVSANCNGGHHSEEHADRYFFGGCVDEGYEFAGDAYAALWESINGRDSWTVNPWVWVVSFRRL